MNYTFNNNYIIFSLIIFILYKITININNIEKRQKKIETRLFELANYINKVHLKVQKNSENISDLIEQDASTQIALSKIDLKEKNEFLSISNKLSAFEKLTNEIKKSNKVSQDSIIDIAIMYNESARRELEKEMLHKDYLQDPYMITNRALELFNHDYQ